MRSALISICFLGAFWGQAVGQEIPSIVVPSNACGLDCQIVLAQDSVRRNSSVADRHSLVTEQAQEKLDAYLDKYDATRESYRSLQSTREYAKFAMDLTVAGNDVPGFEAAVEMSAVVYDRAFENQTAKLAQDQADALKRITQDFMRFHSEEHAERLGELSKLPPGSPAFADAVDSAVSALQGSTWTKLEVADQALVSAGVTKLLADTLKAGHALQAEKDRQQDAGLEAAFVSVHKVAQTVALVNNKLESVAESQRALVGAVKTISGITTLNRNDLDDLRSVLWGNMTPTQKLKALDSDYFTRKLKPEQVTALKTDLERFARAQDVLNTANEISSVANSSMSILSTLGVLPPQTAKVINRGLGLLQGAVTAYAGYMTGNPAMALQGAAGVVGSLFGSDSAEDTTGPMLVAILEQLAVMQKQMYEYHKETMEALVSISKQIDTRYASLFDANRTLLARLAFVQRGLGHVLLNEFEACGHFLENWRDWDRREVGWDERRSKFAATLQSDVSNCALGMDNLFREQAGKVVPSAGVAWEAYEGSDMTAMKPEFFKERIYNPTYGLTKRLISQDSPTRLSEDRLLLMLTNPVLTLDRAKVLREEAAENSLGSYRVPNTAGRLVLRVDAGETFRDLLAPPAIADAAEKVLGVAGLYGLLDSPSSSSATLRTLDTLRESGEADNAARTRARLGRALALVELSLVQVQMLDGSAVAADAAVLLQTSIEAHAAGKLVFGDEIKDAASLFELNEAARCEMAPSEYLQLLCVMHRNRLFAENVFLAWVRLRMSATNRGMHTYIAARVMSDAFFPKEILGAVPLVDGAGVKWGLLREAPFTGGEVEWSLVLPKPEWWKAPPLKIFLPSVDVVRSGTLLHQEPAFSELVEVRERLINEISERESVASLTEGDPDLRRLLLAAAIRNEERNAVANRNAQ